MLPKILDAYNNYYPRIIKMKPADVNQENCMLLWERLYGNTKRNVKAIQNVNEGDHVQISKFKVQFEKVHLPNWTPEEFICDKNQ